MFLVHDKQPLHATCMMVLRSTISAQQDAALCFKPCAPAKSTICCGVGGA